MSDLRWLDVPFHYTTGEDFQHRLMEWLGDVFYEHLPARGYEIREEQIYTSFRMAEAICHKEALLAEAGSGTGKTFAYLLPSLCYARHAGKPVILSSASALLQEQLAGKTGDIRELSRLLDLNIDVRVAKDPRNYLCRKKAEQETWLSPETEGLGLLNEWKLTTALGDRAEIPEISDDLWQTVAWEETLACDQCQHRGYCQVAKNRLHIWAAKDFVVASHDQFFRHLWSSDYREEEGLPPLLPASSAMIFDEGHLLERPAIEQLGHRLSLAPIESIRTNVWNRRKLLSTKLVVDIDLLWVDARKFFEALQAAAEPNETSNRWFVELDDELYTKAERWSRSLQTASERLSIETEQLLWTPLETELRIASQRIEQAEAALRQLLQPRGRSVVWWEHASEVFWILPSSFGTMIGKELSRDRQPLVFTSATLQAAGSFQGMKQMLGLPTAKESLVTTSFELAQQMAAYLPDLSFDTFAARAEHCLELMLQNGGKALVLLNHQSELQLWQDYLQDRPLPFPVLWEGDGDRSWLLQRFREEGSSVLIGTSFWEGVDVPGEALSLVAVFSLPFPEHDPLLVSKRLAAEQAGLDPILTVDVTEMLIKLRQGYGRLIRTATDRGVIALLDLGQKKDQQELVQEALPTGVSIWRSFEQAKAAVAER